MPLHFLVAGTEPSPALPLSRLIAALAGPADGRVAWALQRLSDGVRLAAGGAALSLSAGDRQRLQQLDCQAVEASTETVPQWVSHRSGGPDATGSAPALESLRLRVELDGGVAAQLSLWRVASEAAETERRLQDAWAQIELLQQALHAAKTGPAGAVVLAGAVAAPASDLGRFEEEIRRELDLSLRERREFSIALVEVAPLPFPPGPGADAADAALMLAVERILRSNTRTMDAVAPVGPRRFGLLLSGAALSLAYARAEAIRRVCATEVAVVDGHGEPYNVAFGLCAFPHTADAIGDLLAAAGEALQTAVFAGGNRVVVAPIAFEPARYWAVAERT